MANPVMALYVYIMERLFPLFYGKLPCCTISQSTAGELIAKGFPERGISIVEPGIDLDYFCPDSAVEREEDLLVCVGRLKKYKRVDYVLEAMRILDGKGYKLRLVVIGAGDDLPRVKKRAAELKLGDRVEFVGFVGEDKKIGYLRRAAIYVNPSEKEGWGITNIEASACGTPVVANTAPGLRESVVDNETGLLYKENDVASLAESLEKLLGDKELRARFGERGRLFAQNFSWDAKARKAEEWVRKIAREE
jgi:glycosyltransferase involved in cell wall biosynthesis